MARTSKAKSEQTESSSAPVAQTQQSAQPVVEQKVKAPRAKKSSAAPPPVSEPVVAAPTPTPAPASVAQASTSDETPPPEDGFSELTALSGEFLTLSGGFLTLSGEFLTKLNNWVSTGASLKSEFRSLEKRWARELKNAQKSKKRTKRGGNRSPSGFVKPTKISDELAVFLDKPLGYEMARTQVTKEINNYIRVNGLQDKENGRHIIPDNKLSGLLKITKDDELTYFNLQRYMSPHFPKKQTETSE